MAKTPAQARANAKYDKNNYDRVGLLFRKDAEINVDVIRRYAESKNVSVNALIRNALEKMIRNDPDFVI